MPSLVRAGMKRPAQSTEAEFQPSLPKKMKKKKVGEEERLTVGMRNYQRRRMAPRKGRIRHLHAQEGLVRPFNEDVALHNGPMLTDIDVSRSNGPMLTDIDVSRSKRRSRDIDIGRERQIMKIGRKAASFVKPCKTCLDRKKICCENVPCGHMTNCCDCAPLMLKCAQCAQDIGGTRPTQDTVWKFLVDSTDSGMFLENSYGTFSASSVAVHFTSFQYV